MTALLSTDSRKSERFIQIGKHRHRIACDHHKLLADIKDEFGYLSMEQLLFLTSLIGASILQVFNPFTVIKVRKRAEARK